MSLLFPNQELKNTLTSVDATLHDVRQSVIPKVAQSLTTINVILEDLSAITKALREVFVKNS